MKTDNAESIALQGLAFLAGHEAELEAFLAQTGMGLDDLRANAADPATLAGILDFLLAEERRLLDFCEAWGIDPSLPATARRTLPGGDTGYEP